MREGWQKKTLPEVCDFQRGLTYSKDEEVEISNNVVLRATNIDLRSNSLDLSDLRYISDSVAVPSNKLVKRDSLLICTASGSKSHLGKVAYIDDDYGYAFGGFMGMLTPKDNIVPKYLFYLMTSTTYQDFIGAVSDGTNINNLKFDDLKSFPVPLPPLPEQRRIVALLDEAFDGIAAVKANAERNLRNAGAIFESYLNNVLNQHCKGWLNRPLAELCDIKHGFAFEGDEFSSDVPKGNPLVITPGNFTEDGSLSFNGGNTKRYGGVPRDDFRFNVGDLVVVMTDLSSKMKILGKPAFIESNDVLHNQRIGRVFFKETSVLPKYVYYYMMTEIFLKSIKDSATGTMVKHTAPSRILSNIISFPLDKDEQENVVAILDLLREEIQALKSVFDKKLLTLKALKTSLLHHAFAGEL